MRQSETEDFDWVMYVTSIEWNEERAGWDYRLRSLEGIPYEGLVKETNLEDPN